MKRATREWVGKAEDDFQAAHQLANSKPALHDQVCFHCQQSVEKYLKALLDEQGAVISKTHDLELLLNLLTKDQPSIRPFRRGLAFLTDFAVEMRYPGNDATKRQAAAALRWTRRVREACRNLLKIRSRRP